MAFCKNCGTQLQGDEHFCVSCGTDVSAQTAAAGTPAQVVVPGPYTPGAIPIAVAMPPQLPAKSWGVMKTLLVLALLAGGYYYYYTTHKTPVPPHPDVSAALAGQQAFDAHWQDESGYIQISNGKWTNNATVPIQSATLECDQYDSRGTGLAHMQTTLNGPVQPGASTTFSPFQMGAVTVNLSRVTCTIVKVNPAN